MTAAARTFAIIPAAGLSRRMGRAKLLLPWEDGLVIDSVLRAWTTSDVDQTCIVVRTEDQALQAHCRQWPVEVVVASPAPEDMKASLLRGLAFLESAWAPTADDCWITAPADVPQLTASVINAVVGVPQANRIVAARYGSRAGHPVRLPWDLHRRLAELAPDEGLNRLLAAETLHFVDFPAEQRPRDVDTWSEYQALRGDTPVDPSR